MTLKLQKTVPVDFVGGSQEPFPVGYAPSKPKTRRSPDSVPNQESRNFQKRPPIGKDPVSKENSYFLGEKTNRKSEKHKLY